MEKYQQNYDKSFSQEIIQHIMKQIVEAVKYLHNDNIVHNNIKLNSIFVNFETEEDKNKLNMLKSKVKLGRFKLAEKSSDLLRKETTLEKFQNERQKQSQKQLKKNDIFELGKICYQMLFGKYDINWEDMEKIIEEIKKDKFNTSITLSKEIISFLRSTLNMEVGKRLKIYELISHDFLNKNIKDFQLINEKNDNAYISEEKDKNEREEESDKKNICIICHTNVNEITISPCGHKCICENCFLKLNALNNLKDCPMCKKPVESIHYTK